VEIAVLLKVVPDIERLRFDPERRTVIRAGVELLTNAFDQRALRVALEAARPGDTVRVLSLGPPGAIPRLQEAIALGAGSARLLTDMAFAGSDVLATARTLARGLSSPTLGLVVAGARSLDSDTGLVGPEVAEFLGWPLVANARALHREEREVEATVDTASGWAKVTSPLPAVVTVGEKITKPLRLDDAARARAPGLPVEQVGLEALGLSRDAVGAPGSPTSVVALGAPAPSRQCELFRDGTPESKVDGALAALRSRLERAPARPEPLPLRTSGFGGPKFGVLVTEEHGRLDPGMLGWCSEARRSAPSFETTAVWVGPSPSPDETQAVGRSGASIGVRAETATSPLPPGAVVEVLASFAATVPTVDSVVVPATPFGREVAGRWAASALIGAVGDATEFAEAPGPAILWRKPSFGSRMIATIQSRTRPSVATVAPWTHTAAEDDRSGFAWQSLPSPTRSSPLRRTEEGTDPLSGPDPARRPVVVAVGMGVGGPEGVATASELARRWGAAVVGTRRVVDAGWLPARLQVGVTGRSLAPRLAVLLGVRGAAHHMSGWRRAGVLLAVNKDPAAPVFADADVGIVASIEEALPVLAEKMPAVLSAVGRS
jgi:electron transfer flavoprotein alpha subunit